MRASSVLIAVSEGAQPRLERVLERYAIVRAASCEEVAARLRERRFGLIVLGTHFAESSLFEVLELVLRERRGPVVCVQAVPFSYGLGKSTFAACRSACLALGARRVIDLTQFPDNNAGDTRVRELLEAQIDFSASFAPSSPLPFSSGA